MKKDLLNEIKQLWEIKNLSAIRSLLLEENPVDIAETFEELGEKVLPTIYRLLPKELAAEVFVELDGDAEERLIHALSDKELSKRSPSFLRRYRRPDRRNARRRSQADFKEQFAFRPRRDQQTAEI